MVTCTVTYMQKVNGEQSCKFFLDHTGTFEMGDQINAYIIMDSKMFSSLSFAGCTFKRHIVKLWELARNPLHAVIGFEGEQKLWDTGVLKIEMPLGLFNAVFTRNWISIWELEISTGISAWVQKCVRSKQSFCDDRVLMHPPFPSSAPLPSTVNLPLPTSFPHPLSLLNCLYPLSPFSHISSPPNPSPYSAIVAWHTCLRAWYSWVHLVWEGGWVPPTANLQMKLQARCSEEHFMLLVVHAGSPNLLSFLLLLTLQLMSRHVPCNAIHDATPTCCMINPHYIPHPQVIHFLRNSMECSLYKYLAHCWYCKIYSSNSRSTHSASRWTGVCHHRWLYMVYPPCHPI